MRSSVLILLLLVLLAFVLGAVLFSRGPSPEYRAALEAQRLETKARMAALQVVFWHGLAGVALLFLVGLTIAFLRLLWRRSQLIRPNASGIFPIVRGRAGRQVYYHDPNRQLAGTVAYCAGDVGVEAQHLLPAGSEAEPFGVAQDRQLQVTTQAQAAQVVAAGQGRGMSRTTRRVVERMTAPRSAPPLPTVMIVQGELADPDDRRLAAAIRRDWEEVEGDG